MDRRQLKTRKAILKAFYKLSLEKNIDKITVTEISQVADIGKSTFYTHFETKDFLIIFICEDFFLHLKENENTDNFSGIKEQLEHLLIHVCDKENHIFRLVKSDNIICNKFFVEYLSGIFLKYLKDNNSLNIDFALNHIVDGFLSAIRWYMDNENIITKEKLISDFLYFNSTLI